MAEEKVKKSKDLAMTLEDFLNTKQPLTNAELYYYRGNFEDNTSKTPDEWSVITGL